MEKYAVSETNKDKGDLDKQASAGCPECGAKLQRHGDTLLCPNCGSAPFEEKK